MPATALVTSEQYLALPDEFDQSGNRIDDELIGGEIVRMGFSAQLHNIVKANIIQALFAYVAVNEQLKLKALAEMAFIVTPHDVLIPDASVIARSRLNPRADKYIRGAPELAVEVVSPTDTATRLKHKVDAYLQNGSKTVWVVYPDSRSVVVHSGDSAHELKADQRIEDSLLPDFSVPVSAFFELT
jgi:Uma2 family endonuclease